MAKGQPLALRIHPDIILTPEGIMDVQMLGKRGELRAFGHQIEPLKIELKIAVADIERRPDMAVANRLELFGQARRRRRVDFAQIFAVNIFNAEK